MLLLKQSLIIIRLKLRIYQSPKNLQIYDTALNWGEPEGELLWDKMQQTLFEEEAKSAYKQLCAELGSDYKVSFFPHIF